MGDVIMHSRFDRPKVHQPCPRRRKGTIDLRKYRREQTIAEAATGFVAINSRDMVPAWIDGQVRHGDFFLRLNQAGLTLRPCKDERGICSWLIAYQQRPPETPPAA